MNLLKNSETKLHIPPSILEPLAPVIDSKESIVVLEKFGLLSDISNGKNTAAQLPQILQFLKNDKKALETRISVSSKLVVWQSKANDEVKDMVLRQNYHEFSSQIKNNLLRKYESEQFESECSHNSKAESIGLHLAQCLAAQAKQSQLFSYKLCMEVIAMLREAMTLKLKWHEKTEYEEHSIMSLRADIVHELIKCLPLDDNDNDVTTPNPELEATLGLLMQLLAYCNNENTVDSSVSLRDSANGLPRLKRITPRNHMEAHNSGGSERSHKDRSHSEKEQSTEGFLVSTSGKTASEHSAVDMMYNTANLKLEISTQIQYISEGGSVNTSSAVRKNMSYFEGHLSSMLVAINQHHQYEFVSILQKSLKNLSISTAAVEDNLEGIIQSLGFDDLVDTIVQVAERDVRKILNCVPTLLAELDNCITKHKVVIFGMFLSVVMVDMDRIAGILPSLYSAVINCTSTVLCIPFFKIVALVATRAGSEDLVLHCLSLLSKLMKLSLLQKSPVHVKSALLSSINVMKDHVPFCNIFSRETLALMSAVYRPANVAVFENIYSWNAGKKARRGDVKSYLLTAGWTSDQQDGSNNPERRSLLSRWFGRSNRPARINSNQVIDENLLPVDPSSRSSSGGATATRTPRKVTQSGIAKINSVSPSPQSQNLAVLLTHQIKDDDERIRSVEPVSGQGSSVVQNQAKRRLSAVVGDNVPSVHHAEGNSNEEESQTRRGQEGVDKGHEEAKDSSAAMEKHLCVDEPESNADEGGGESDDDATVVPEQQQQQQQQKAHNLSHQHQSPQVTTLASPTPPRHSKATSRSENREDALLQTMRVGYMREDEPDLVPAAGDVQQQQRSSLVESPQSRVSDRITQSNLNIDADAASPSPTVRSAAVASNESERQHQRAAVILPPLAVAESKHEESAAVDHKSGRKKVKKVDREESSTDSQQSEQYTSEPKRKES